MNRGQFLKVILRRVASKLLKNKSTSSIYSLDKGFLAESDILAHETFKAEIMANFPNDYILSEEDNLSTNNINLENDFSWIIDPICGTTNYLYDIPFYSHSATIFRKNKLHAAGVLDPLRDELFFSSDNKFYVNDKLVSLKKETPIKEAIISINTNQSNFENDKHSLKHIINKLSPPVCRRNRIMESANLELAYVACGRLDAYYNPTDKPWDIAAAQLLIPSAGGAVHILNNPNENIFNQKGILAAGSRTLLEQILRVIK